MIRNFPAQGSAVELQCHSATVGYTNNLPEDRHGSQRHRISLTGGHVGG